MATLFPLTPRRRRRRLWIGLAVVLAAVVAWRGIEGMRENVARRPFVGTWRFESWADPARPELVWETDLRPDGTQQSRLRDSQTGDIVRDLPSNLRWRVVEGRLQQGHYGQTLLNEISHGPWGAILIFP